MIDPEILNKKFSNRERDQSKEVFDSLQDELMDLANKYENKFVTMKKLKKKLNEDVSDNYYDSGIAVAKLKAEPRIHVIINELRFIIKELKENLKKVNDEIIALEGKSILKTDHTDDNLKKLISACGLLMEIICDQCQKIRDDYKDIIEFHLDQLNKELAINKNDAVKRTELTKNKLMALNNLKASLISYRGEINNMIAAHSDMQILSEINFEFYEDLVGLAEVEKKKKTLIFEFNEIITANFYGEVDFFDKQETLFEDIGMKKESGSSKIESLKNLHALLTSASKVRGDRLGELNEIKASLGMGKAEQKRVQFSLDKSSPLLSQGKKEPSSEEKNSLQSTLRNSL